ncbi:MAG TPA: aminotransferase class III-fold pyridoxal phosphate-dependent enzyme, partial [Geminicoccaceae bacterium]|nr:aminotransferase class III-fold pyridoxal phosphate-dependent enzyme [Geminicoccaceae bacterium]
MSISHPDGTDTPGGAAPDMESSGTMWERATRVIAGGASSSARLNPALVVRRAEGAYLEGADGRRYIDYMMGLGPAILGHAPEPVLAAVVDSLRLGQTPAATHVLEIELAERVARLVPSAELVRFVATGTEAVQAVLRLARGHTGRARIVKFEGHYHGWLDSVLVSLHPDPALVGPAQRPNAVPGSRRGQAPGAFADVIVMPWNDLDALAALFAERGAEIAGVIMEPVMCNTCVIPPEPGY